MYHIQGQTPVQDSTNSQRPTNEQKNARHQRSRRISHSVNLRNGESPSQIEPWIELKTCSAVQRPTKTHKRKENIEEKTKRNMVLDQNASPYPNQNPQSIMLTHRISPSPSRPAGLLSPPGPLPDARLAALWMEAAHSGQPSTSTALPHVAVGDGFWRLEIGLSLVLL